MATRTRDIICFGTDWYSPSKVSIRQIVEEFHGRGARVLWVNPVPIRFPSTRRKEFWSKVQHKARTHARLLSRQGDGLWVYSPLYVPYYRGPGFQVNRLAVSLQILMLRLLLGLRRPLVFGSMFTTWFALPAVGGCPMVFHFADKISAFREVSGVPERRRVLEAMEQEIVRAATLATCSSAAIHRHVAGLGGGAEGKAVLLPHAVRADTFLSPPAGGWTVPGDLAGLPHPIAGYFGSLTHTNDAETFLAAARDLPAWSFVFIGRVSGDYTALEALPNVHFLGPRPHGEIPAYGSAFDVCFMGWRAHEWIANCFPLKTLEYLSLGRPVVCAGHIPEVEERFGGLVTSTDSADGFRAALVAAVRDDSAVRQAERIAAVRGETWARRVDTILAELDRRGVVHAV